MRNEIKVLQEKISKRLLFIRLRISGEYMEDTILADLDTLSHQCHTIVNGELEDGCKTVALEEIYADLFNISLRVDKILFRFNPLAQEWTDSVVDLFEAIDDADIQDFSEIQALVLEAHALFELTDHSHPLRKYISCEEAENIAERFRWVIGELRDLVL